MKYTCIVSVFCCLLLANCNNQNKPVVSDSLAIVTPVASQNQSLGAMVSCKEIAYQILTTSPRFKELTKNLYDAVIKNGGTSYGTELEGSPNPEQDSAMNYSKTYDFSLHETYPDRMITTARFTFNPNAKQLYEYEVAQDSLIPIDFDKKGIIDKK